MSSNAFRHQHRQPSRLLGNDKGVINGITLLQNILKSFRQRVGCSVRSLHHCTGKTPFLLFPEQGHTKLSSSRMHRPLASRALPCSLGTLKTTYVPLMPRGGLVIVKGVQASRLKWSHIKPPSPKRMLQVILWLGPAGPSNYYSTICTGKLVTRERRLQTATEGSPCWKRPPRRSMYIAAWTPSVF